jgi:hypothetical protein
MRDLGYCRHDLLETLRRTILGLVFATTYAHVRSCSVEPTWLSEKQTTYSITEFD